MNYARTLDLNLHDEESFDNELDALDAARAAAGAILLSILKPLGAGTYSDETLALALDFVAPYGPGRSLFEAACPADDGEGLEGDWDAFGNVIRARCRMALKAGRVKAVGEKRQRAAKKAALQADLFEEV